MAQLSADLSQLTPEQKKQLEEKLKNMPPGELKALQKQQCIFCQIIAGKVPSKKVYEDDKCLAVLDINPAAKGHLLLLPKEHFSIMPQLPDKILAHLSLVSKQLSQIQLRALKAEGVSVFIANGPAAGQRAQHFMIHLIPRKTADKVLDFEEKLVDKEIMEKVRSAIGGVLKKLLSEGQEWEQESKKEDKEEDKESKEEHKKEEKRKERLEELQEEKFISSDTAKRYHREKCPFAQNIPFEKKIILTAKEASKSDKLPCTCVTGKRIPLKKIKEKKPEAEVRQDAESAKTSENTEHTFPKKQPKKEDSKKEGLKEDVSLDDIATLFK